MKGRVVIGPCVAKQRRQSPVWMHTPEIKEWKQFRQRWARWKKQFEFNCDPRHLDPS